MSERWIVVVPCYNEAARLRPEAFLCCLETMPAVRFLFVDDGSRDWTKEVLAGLQRRAQDRLRLLALPTNHGKGEAVRLGVLEAFAWDADVVAYWDADLATPLEALSDFAAVLDSHPDIDILLGSRVRLLGRDIERYAIRHYFGRLFATAASLVLGLPVYDTQCGAKAFRARTRRLFESPFVTRWVFDVELLSRSMMHAKPDGTPEFNICEMPLRVWHDIAGSKVRPSDALRAVLDLTSIYLRRRRHGHLVAFERAARVRC
jgi:dolichyl-phosphate beta-glucosyltransferase